MAQALLVWMTVPKAEVAETIGRALVSESLAACVNIVPGVRSIYRWEGKVQDEAELLLIAKTTAAKFEALAARVKALHPYSVPEVIAAPITHGFAPYLKWIAESVRAKS
jgi:periplasmic divalent cation tolerance protein